MQDTLSNIVGILIGLSIATERLVEIIKGFWPWLNTKQGDAKKEGQRQAVIHILASLCGIATALLAHTAIRNSIESFKWNELYTIALGLFASGGSGFWNNIQTYLKSTKDIKTAESEKP